MLRMPLWRPVRPSCNFRVYIMDMNIMMLVSSLPRLIVGHTSCVGLFCFNVVVVWMYNTSYVLSCCFLYVIVST